jgi:ribonuclease HI
MEILAYTDGSAVTTGVNKGRGGFGVYFPDINGKKAGIHIGFEQTKTGRMEVSALLHAIKHFETDEKFTLTVYSDSQYVTKTFTEKRLQKWKSNNWISGGFQIKNIDLWKAIDEALSNRPNLKLQMIWIKGHQVEKEKNPVAKAYLMKDPHIVGNLMADHIANRWRLNIGKLETSDIYGKY